MGRVLDPLPLMYKDINGHSAVVNPDGYKGHWNMRLRGNELSLPVADGYRSLAYKVVGAMGWLVRRVAFK